MKSKTMILLVVAVGCGLVASYMTSRLLAERNTTKPDEDEKVIVLVAKQNLAMGTMIKDPQQYFMEKPFTKGEEPKKSVHTFDQLKDRQLNKPLAAEQWVSVDDLWSKEQAGLSGLMPPGTRAMSIRVNLETGTAGFVTPGSRVDVVSISKGGGPEATSQILLQNMLVLAADTQYIRDERQAIQASTVTLAVKPEEALRLNMAGSGGELRLILRIFGDNEIVRTRPITARDVATGSNLTGQPSGEDDANGPKLPGALSKLPEIPNTPGATKESEPEPDVKTPKTHTLTIHNGETVTRAVFVLSDKEGETTTHIEKSSPEGDTPPAAPKIEKKPEPSATAPSGTKPETRPARPPVH